MKLNKKIINIVCILILCIFAISCVEKTFQNDTFFTIALGERTVKYGIEEYDQLVWHDNLKFIHLRWLFDVVIYSLNNEFGFDGIFVFIIVIAVLQGLMYYAIMNSFTKNKLFSFFSSLVLIYINQYSVAARGQIMSFLLFLVEFYALNKFINENKKRYIPILLLIPILIVNFHASVLPVYFVFYLPYIAEYVASKLKIFKGEDSKIIVNKIEDKTFFILIGMMIASIILGLISPIGLDAYKYMFNVMGGVSTDFISELQPVNIITQLYYTSFICVFVIVIAFTKTKIRLVDLLYILGFLVLSLPTSRCIYFFYMFAGACILRLVYEFFRDSNVKINIFDNKILSIMLVLILVYISIISITDIVINSQEPYINYEMIPENATNFILNNLDCENMRLFNHFDFGSYLEYKGIKVFMDSRSEMYTKEFNKDVTLLEEWNDTSYGLVHYNEIMEKYDITHALLYNDEVIAIYMATDDNWNCIYKDNMFCIYEKVNN